jgi:DNA polymerase IV (DinB-like DNA polymerase)
VKTSDKVMDILRKYADKFEQWGLDEAFLDISGRAKNFSQAEIIVEKIKKEIKQKEQLTCSIGIASNRSVAKIASDYQKPDGLTVVTPKKVKKFLKPLLVRKLLGVGSKMEKKLLNFGIKTIGQLSQMPKKFLAGVFGKWGASLYYLSRGIDESEVSEAGVRKSIGHEHTFERDVSDGKVIFSTLDKLSRKVYKDLRRKKFRFKTVVIKIRYANFETHTRQITLERETDRLSIIQDWARELVKPFLKKGRKIRLLGVRVSGLRNISEK